jgi:hypothetical protein
MLRFDGAVDFLEPLLHPLRLIGRTPILPPSTSRQYESPAGFLGIAATLVYFENDLRHKKDTKHKNKDYGYYDCNNSGTVFRTGCCFSFVASHMELIA